MISELKIMKGPNMWAKQHSQLIVIKLETPLELHVHMDEVCTTISELFPEMAEELKAIPKLTQPELFIAGLIARVAIYLQRLSGATVYYSDVHLLGTDAYYAVFEYEQSEHGKATAEAAETLLTTVLKGEKPVVEPTLKMLQSLYTKNDAGPSTHEILQAAKKRGIPVTSVVNGEYILLGYGTHLKKIQATISDVTGM